MNDRHNDILAEKVQVPQAVRSPECFAAVLEIADEMPVPDDTQRVGLTKLHVDIGGMNQGLFQVGLL